VPNQLVFRLLKFFVVAARRPQRIESGFEIEFQGGCLTDDFEDKIRELAADHHIVSD
jgi:hypothetical protein